MKTAKLDRSWRWMVVLVLLTNAIPPLAIDEFTPSMPHMVLGLDTSVAAIQLTVTLYMLAFSLSQFIGGFLSDAWGRRPVLLASIPLFFVGSLLVIFAPSVGWVLWGRLIQGLGVGVCALTGPALMADCFEGEAITRVSGYYGTVYSFIPISAPIIGGLIQDALGWRYNFVFLLLVSIVVYVIFALKLPETHQPDESHRLSWSNAYRNVMTVLSRPQYIFSVLAMLLVWGQIPVFSIMGPFIMQKGLGFSATVFGFQALLVGLGFFVGSFANTQLQKRFTSCQLIWLGVALMIIAAFCLFVLALSGVFNAWSVMLPVFAVMIGGGLAFPNLYGQAVSAVPEYAGIAGAMIGSIILLGAVIITALVTQFHAHSALVLAVVMLLMSLACLIFISLKIKMA